MMILVSCLLLASLTLTPVHSRGTWEKFHQQHTYHGNTLVDCESFLNPVLVRLNMGCKECNTIILGDNRYSTNINEVINICRHGTPVSHPRGNRYISHRPFQVVTCYENKCRNNLPHLPLSIFILPVFPNQPPHCKYNKVNEWNIQLKYITVACENGLPVHFEGC